MTGIILETNDKLATLLNLRALHHSRLLVGKSVQPEAKIPSNIPIMIDFLLLSFKNKNYYLICYLADILNYIATYRW